MNKIGFYIHDSTVPSLRDALRKVQPPTILMHAGDRGLMHEIRRDLSPNSFIVGRMYIESHVQDEWLKDGKPEQHGQDLALGCCLCEVAHGGGQWETFRHLGTDNAGNPIGLIDRIATLRETKAARRPRSRRLKQ